MHKLSLTGLAIFLCTLIVCTSPFEKERESPNSRSPEIMHRIGEVETTLSSPIFIEGVAPYFHTLAEQMEFYQVPGVSIAVINDGKIEWAKGYGLREAGTEWEVDENTLFQAASISKAVSALGALHWVNKGFLDLDADINGFLKSWKVPENEFTKKTPVTLRYLLCHGAGVSGHSLGTYLKGDAVPTYLQILEGLPPSKVAPVRIVVEPRTEFKYSGGGFLIALQALIDVSGKHFADLMKESVLEPAGMKRSGYYQPLDYGSIENVAAGHGGMSIMLDGYWQTMANPAGGGLWTTPSELCLFSMEIQKALRGESPILSRRLAEEMLTRQMSDYGLGLFLQGEGEKLAFSHGGGNAGYQSFFFAYANRGQGVAIMANGQNGHYVYNELLRSVAIIYDWPDMKPSIIKPVRIPEAVIKKYVGRYLFNMSLGVQVTSEEDHLKMEGDDGRIFLLYPDAENHFYDLYSGWELRFLFNETDEVIGAALDMGGNELKAEKVIQ